MLAMAPTVTHALSASECEKIRALDKSDPFPFYFKADKSYLPLTAANEGKFWDQVRRQNPDNKGFLFVYLAKSDDDSQSTLFLVKQRFAAGGAADSVGIYNNIRDHGGRAKFDEYQDYHRNGGQYRTWVQWLHLGPGWFFNRDFVDSDEMPLPRRQFAFESEQSGDDLKAYLLAVGGVRPDGSCVDFKPYVSNSTRRISINITNIRKTDTGDPRESYTVSVDVPR
jgi:hypothetical protein